jgi:hypothetical protein
VVVVVVVVTWLQAGFVVGYESLRLTRAGSSGGRSPPALEGQRSRP